MAGVQGLPTNGEGGEAVGAVGGRTGEERRWTRFLPSFMGETSRVVVGPASSLGRPPTLFLPPSLHRLRSGDDRDL